MALNTRPDASALVLVVDDDALVRDMVAASLTRAGYRVVLAADGAAAIDRLDRETPDLILTDLFMPNCDGIELLRSGRLGQAGAPVIAMSGGYAGIDMLGASKALGAAASIAKPFLPRELLAMVQQFLGDAPGAQPLADAPDGRGGDPSGTVPFARAS
jgi:CheY-like chemotaxis protein